MDTRLVVLIARAFSYDFFIASVTHFCVSASIKHIDITLLCSRPRLFCMGLEILNIKSAQQQQRKDNLRNGRPPLVSAVHANCL